MRDVLAIALISASTGACAREGFAHREEGTRVVRAIDALITANDGAKAAPLAVLEGTACTDAPACRAKAACSDAFRPLVKSVALKDEIRAALRAPGAAASVDAMQAKVEAAEASQREASANMDGCLRASADARKAYGL